MLSHTCKITPQVNALLQNPIDKINGLMQERRNSIANAMEFVFLALTHWYVHIGHGNGFVLGGTKPLPDPMLAQISCHHMASPGNDE